MGARLGDPRRRIIDLRLRLDDRLEQLQRLWGTKRREVEATLKLATARLNLLSVRRQSEQHRLLLQQRAQQLQQLFVWRFNERRRLVEHFQDRLGHLNPSAILARGYAIVQTLPEQVILRTSRQIAVGADILVRLHRGAVQCQVTNSWNDMIPFSDPIVTKND